MLRVVVFSLERTLMVALLREKNGKFVTVGLACVHVGFVI
jgi:hypothetical protein